MVGERVEARVDVGRLAGLDEAEMPLRQGEMRVLAAACRTRMPMRAKPGAINAAWRGLATRLRMTPAIETSSR